jgi:hypothetical protein
VTVVFGNVSGSTASGERLASESLRKSDVEVGGFLIHWSRPCSSQLLGLRGGLGLRRLAALARAPF